MRQIISLFLAIAMVLSLCACAPESGTDSSTADPIPGQTESTHGSENDHDETSATEPSTSATDPTETESTIGSTEPTEKEPSIDATDPTEPLPSDPSVCAHEYEVTFVKESNCTEGGCTESVCTKCGEGLSAETPPTGHRYTAVSCTKPKTCSVCGTTEGAALGHSYTGGECLRCGAVMPNYQDSPTGCNHDYRVASQEASSCTEEGSITYTCSSCGDDYVEALPVSNHHYAAATCTKGSACTVCGKTQGSALGHSYGRSGLCSRCGMEDPNYEEEPTEPSACEHNYSITSRKDATCTETGRVTYTCRSCGDSYSEAIASTGHDYASRTCTQPSTCAVCGTSYGSPMGHSYGSNGLCSRCGAMDPSYTEEPTEPGGCDHNYSITNRKDATCTKKGSVTYTCGKCGNSYTESIAASGHDLAPATCTATSTCSICGSTSGNPLGHSYGDDHLCTRCGIEDPDYTPPCQHVYRVTGKRPAACTTAGVTTYTCSKCRHSYQESIPATGHDYAPATCEKPQTCADCDATTGSALGHSYGSDYRCSRCGKSDPNGPTDINVTVRSDKGAVIPDITVSIYTGSASQPDGTAITDSKGQVTIRVDDISSGYRIILSNVPAKYIAKESYSFSSSRANITLTSASITTPTDHSNANYKVGSTMGDFTLTDTDGISYTLSELLKEKELVILNFWYVACVPCKAEFPYFEAVYKQYEDDVTLLTMSHFDSEESIKELREQMGVTFPMIREDIGFREGFGLAMYPTTVFIDSTGKILKIEVGGYKSEQELIDAIESFL